MASKYAEETNQRLSGRTIKEARVTGYGIDLVLDDGSVFEYDASDGGYSCWDFRNTEEEVRDGE